MKKVGCSFYFLILSFVLLFAQRTQAEETTLTVTPSQLTVSGTRGASEVRTLALRAEQPIQKLQFLSLDLERADKKTVLQADAITAKAFPKSIDSTTPITVPLTFSLLDPPICWIVTRQSVLK